MFRLRLLTLLFLTMLTGTSLAQVDVDTYVSSIAFNQDGSLIAVGMATDIPCRDSNLYTIQLINVASSSLENLLPGHGCPILSLDFSFDGTKLVSSDIGADIIIWDVLNRNMMSKIGTGAEAYVLWNPDENLILRHNIYTVYVTDLAGDFLSTQKSAYGEITTAVWNTEGDRVAFADDSGSIQIWNTTTNVIERTLSIHSAAISSLDWNPVSELIASADESGIVNVWDESTGTIVTSLTNTAKVNDLVWSPNGRALASAGDDGVVRVWNIQNSAVTSQTVLNELTSRNYQAPVYAVAWSPDGTKIAYGGQGTGGQNGRAEISDLNTGLSLKAKSG